MQPSIPDRCAAFPSRSDKRSQKAISRQNGSGSRMRVALQSSRAERGPHIRRERVTQPCVKLRDPSVRAGLALSVRLGMTRRGISRRSHSGRRPHEILRIRSVCCRYLAGAGWLCANLADLWPKNLSHGFPGSRPKPRCAKAQFTGADCSRSVIL